MREDIQYDLSVVIVNFRTPKFVTECLATLLPELKDVKAGVVVVDNHSGDGSADAIDQWLREHDADGAVKHPGPGCPVLSFAQ